MHQNLSRQEQIEVYLLRHVVHARVCSVPYVVFRLVLEVEIRFWQTFESCACFIIISAIEMGKLGASKGLPSFTDVLNGNVCPQNDLVLAVERRKRI